MIDPCPLCCRRMTERILLATTVKWPSAAYLAGAFAALGCSVEAVFPRGHALGVSRHVGRAHTYYPLRPHSSFAAAIAAAKPDLIVPCDDRAVSHLLSIEAQAPALKSVGLPAVLKADGSWGGDGVAVVRTHEEASRAFRKLAGPPSRLRSLSRAVLRKDAHFLQEALVPKTAPVQVQRFIRGKPATSAFACRDGEVLAAIHMDVVQSRGATGPAMLIERTDCNKMDEAARRIARRFGLSGLHGLDFVRDDDGVPHLIEINPRATQICHLALGAGHDLPSALLSRPPRLTATDSPLIALFPQAWSTGRLSPDALAAYHDVPWDDPEVVSAAIGSGFTLLMRQPRQKKPAAGLQFLTDGLKERGARRRRLQL